jgi:predicted Fe-Mo cluster-binding NifX family protein
MRVISHSSAAIDTMGQAIFVGTRVACVPVTMRIAIPVWDDWVSPVFDVAKRIRVTEVINGTIHSELEHEPENGDHAATLSNLGVDVLVCAAISPDLEKALWDKGVEVISDTCGPATIIAEAYARGDTALRRFHSPGYSDSRRRHREAFERERRRSG